MNPWFRLYVEALDDPKVQRLPGDHFKFWINLLCIAARCSGRLPPPADIAFMLRLPEPVVVEILAALKVAVLIDEDEEGLSPHNWNQRQYKSDVSTARVQKHRQQHQGRRNVPRNVSETKTGNVSEALHETAPEQNRGGNVSSKRSSSSRGRASPEPARPRPVWVLKNDRRANGLADRYCREKNKPSVPWQSGEGGMGWFFDPEWLRGE